MVISFFLFLGNQIRINMRFYVPVIAKMWPEKEIQECVVFGAKPFRLQIFIPWA
jgi:hypothetical protein